MGLACERKGCRVKYSDLSGWIWHTVERNLCPSPNIIVRIICK